MIKEDKAYIAGFLDGDGSVFASIESHSELKWHYRVRVVLKFSQHDKGKAILKWIRGKLQAGYISSSRHGSELVIKDQQRLKDLLPMLAPYAKVKKIQIKTALELLYLLPVRSKEQLFKVALLADRIGKYNIASRSRRKRFVQDLQHLNDPATTDPALS